MGEIIMKEKHGIVFTEEVLKGYIVYIQYNHTIVEVARYRRGINPLFRKVMSASEVKHEISAAHRRKIRSAA